MILGCVVNAFHNYARNIYYVQLVFSHLNTFFFKGHIESHLSLIICYFENILYLKEQLCLVKVLSHHGHNNTERMRVKI